MTEYQLRLTLLSDATFGRGDGVAGLVDVEVQHDEVGAPFIGGRTLKGVLAAEYADLLFALGRALPDQRERWEKAGDRLFGRRGAGLTGQAILRIGPARLPTDLRQALAADIAQKRLTPTDVLESLTALRRQTAMDENGVPKENSLRTMRVVLRTTSFCSQLSFTKEPSADDLTLLAACVKALRRAGSGRNRGRGRLRAELLDAEGQAVTDFLSQNFRRVALP